MMKEMRNKKLERFTFYWDDQTATIVIVNKDKPREINVLMDNIRSELIAQYVVTAWCGGYLNKERERHDPNEKQHHRIVAEPGFIPILGGEVGGQR